MLPIQRKQALLDHMSRHGGGVIKELSEKFRVSEMTIRRDLLQLEQHGHILRSHGGAIYVDILLGEPALLEKKSKNSSVKESLAAYAAEHFVTEGDVIIMEGGTTVSKMLTYLVHSELTIMTNGLDALSHMKTMANRYTVLCSGGMLREPSGTFVGPVAELFFSQYHANTAFLSALSFNLESGFTDPNLMDTQVKKAMMHSAAKTVMLLDSTKLGNRSFVSIARLDEISALVTDNGIPEHIREACEKLGVELHIV